MPGQVGLFHPPIRPPLRAPQPLAPPVDGPALAVPGGADGGHPSRQLSLLSRGGAPALGTGLPELPTDDLGDGSWVAHRAHAIHGHEALYEHLLRSTRWHAQRRQKYDREVEVPRLVARLPDDGPGHPALTELRGALERRFGLPLRSTWANWYRSGDDSVAPHGDRFETDPERAVVAILSLGQPRAFVLRPATGGPSRTWRLGWGDLLVMGGRCQKTHLHSVPKEPLSGGRISVIFRS